MNERKAEGNRPAPLYLKSIEDIRSEYADSPQGLVDGILRKRRRSIAGIVGYLGRERVITALDVDRHSGYFNIERLASKAFIQENPKLLTTLTEKPLSRGSNLLRQARAILVTPEAYHPRRREPVKPTGLQIFHQIVSEATCSVTNIFSNAFRRPKQTIAGAFFGLSYFAQQAMPVAAQVHDEGVDRQAYFNTIGDMGRKENWPYTTLNALTVLATPGGPVNNPVLAYNPQIGGELLGIINVSRESGLPIDATRLTGALGALNSNKVGFPDQSKELLIMNSVLQADRDARMQIKGEEVPFVNMNELNEWMSWVGLNQSSIGVVKALASVNNYDGRVAFELKSIIEGLIQRGVAIEKINSNSKILVDALGAYISFSIADPDGSYQALIVRSSQTIAAGLSSGY